MELVMLKLAGVGSTWFAYIWFFGVWDAVTTAVLSGVALAVITVFVVAWPQLTAAGVKAASIREDAAVAAAVRFKDLEIAALRQDIAGLRQEIEQLRKDLHVSEHDLRVENQQVEQRRQKWESEAIRWKMRYQVAVGQAPTSSDDIAVTPPDPPILPAAPAKDAHTP